MEKDALSVSGIDLGSDASLGSAGPVVPADEAWVVGWLVGPSNLGGSPTLQPADFSAQSATANTNTHTHACAHTHTQKRAHPQIHENTKNNCCVMHIPRHTHIRISSEKYPNSDFVISNSCSDVNLKSSLFSMNVILPDNSFIRGSLEFACPLAL